MFQIEWVNFGISSGRTCIKPVYNDINLDQKLKI